LRGHVSQRNAEGQPISLQVAAAAFARDGGRYLRLLRAGDYRAGPDLPGDGQIVTGRAEQDGLLPAPDSGSGSRGCHAPLR
jgi:hypothetical protein